MVIPHGRIRSFELNALFQDEQGMYFKSISFVYLVFLFWDEIMLIGKRYSLAVLRVRK